MSEDLIGLVEGSEVFTNIPIRRYRVQTYNGTITVIRTHQRRLMAFGRHDLGWASVARGVRRINLRAELLQRAWLITSTSVGESWGYSVTEAAGWGVACVALNVSGIRDAVIDGQTGWLAAQPENFSQALIDALDQLTNDVAAEPLAEQCQAWARCFSWERSADLLAAVVSYQIGAGRTQRRHVKKRHVARPGIGTVIHCINSPLDALQGQLRVTDQVRKVDGVLSLLLHGCDEFDTVRVLNRLDISPYEIRLADRFDLLVGPRQLPVLLPASPAQPGTGPI